MRGGPAVTSVAAAAILVGVLSSCGGSPEGGPGAATPVGGASTTRSACEGTPTQGRSTVMVDWVDFVRLGGVEYVAGLGGSAASVPPEQVGSVVGRVECRLSALAFAEQPGPAVDGDAAFLPVGTAVHAVTGWPTSCRVTALVDGAYRLYLAQAGGSAASTPAPCATAS